MQRSFPSFLVRSLPLAVAFLASSLALPAAPRKALKAPAAETRLQTALKLAKEHDAEAIPVLIDLLAELSEAKRQPIEEFFSELSGEAMPSPRARGENGKTRRAFWLAWWNRNSSDVLLDAMRKQTPTAAIRERITVLVAQLGEDVFARREKASRELFALGRVALPSLRLARKSSDAEVARRAAILLERIEAAPAHHLPPATLRLLALRKPAGAIEAILAYLPYAEDDSYSEAARKTLIALARRDGKLAPELTRALANESPLVRAAAAQALARGGEREGREAARALLRDAVPSVRLQAALALVGAGERESVPVLIDLLAVLPADAVGQAESVLYQLAGEKSPNESPGTNESERKKYRDVWAAWWKANGDRIDLSRSIEKPLLGYTIICDISNGRVYEIDRHGKERWSIANLKGPVDAWMLPRNRVLIAEFYGNQVSERDLKGNVLWLKGTGSNVINVQRLPNGHTFAVNGGGPLLEFDRAGKEVFRHAVAARNLLGGYRFPSGPLVGLTSNKKCILMDAAGKQLKSFASDHDPGHYGRIDLSPNGRILITQCTRHKAVEYSKEGQKLLEVDAPGICTASALPNGHILVACQEKQHVYELDRRGKIVWEHKHAGGAFRARRR